MKKETKRALKLAYDYCIYNDKSGAFMLQYMQDVAKVNLATVIKYLGIK